MSNKLNKNFWVLSVEGKDPKEAREYYETFPSYLSEGNYGHGPRIDYTRTGVAVRFASKKEAEAHLAANPHPNAQAREVFVS